MLLSSANQIGPGEDEIRSIHCPDFRQWNDVKVEAGSARTLAVAVDPNCDGVFLLPSLRCKRSQSPERQPYLRDLQWECSESLS
jgi:hypothetical protein